MPSWLADPFVRLRFSRLLRWKEALPVVPVLAMVYVAQQFPLFQAIDFPAAFGFIGLIGLLGVIPSIANAFVVMDRDGRLDQLRLSGRGPSRLLTSWSVAFATGPVVLCLVMFGSWRMRVGFPLELLMAMIVLIGGSVALSILALALPRTNPRVDGRQAALGIGFLLLVAAAVILQDQSPIDVLTRTRFRNPLPLSAGAIGLMLLAGQAVLVALVWRHALAAVARPASPRAPSPKRLWAFRALRPHPALYRALVGAVFPAAVASAVTMAVIAGAGLTAAIGGWSPALDVQRLIRSAFPLAVGAVAISLAARDDRDRGRLDVLRLGPVTGLRAIASLSAAHWLLFVMALALAHAAALDAWGSSPRELALAIVVLCIVAPVPLIEGWDRAVPLGYTVPAALVIGVLVADTNTAVLARELWTSAGAVRAGLLCWIPWVCAVRMWRQPDRPALAGWTGILAIAGLTAAAMWPGRRPQDGAEFLTLGLLLGVGFFVGAHSRRAADWWRPMATIVAVGMVVTLIRRSETPVAVVSVLTPAVAWSIAVRLHTWFGDAQLYDRSGQALPVSPVTRASVAAVVFIGSGALEITAWLGSVPRTMTFSGLLLSAALLTELTYRFQLRRARPVHAARNL